MNKITGWFFVFVGLALIFFATISMFKVFTGAQAPVQVITVKPMNVNTQYGPVAMDISMLSGTLNMVMQALFMFFLVAAGGRLAGLGIQFLRTDSIVTALKTNPGSGLRQL